MKVLTDQVLFSLQSVGDVRATSAVNNCVFFSRGEGEVVVGGVSPAVLQLMVGCAQGGVSVVCRRFGEQRSRLG